MTYTIKYTRSTGGSWLQGSYAHREDAEMNARLCNAMPDHGQDRLTAEVVGQVDPRRLYEWLGRQARSAFAEAEANESSVNLDANVGMAATGEAYVEVRRHMRRVDPALPEQDIDRGEGW